MENGTAMLYPLGEGGEWALTWTDDETGYAFWLVSEMPVEDLIRMAESVELYQNNMNDVLEIDTGDPVEAPLCGAGQGIREA